MFACRETRSAETPSGRLDVEVAFTDRWGGVTTGPYESLDLTRDRAGATDDLATNRRLVAEALKVTDVVSMRQVHGADVVVVRDSSGPSPSCDVLVTDVADIALCVRVGDCVPVVLADVTAGVVGVAHVGRSGVLVQAAPAAVDAMRDLGATTIEAWVGPHICAGCYEVPASMRAEVAAVEPAAFGCTTWGTPSVDIGAAVVAQLTRAGCAPVTDVRVSGAVPCTRESEDFFSYRRQGPASGRQAGLVVLQRAQVPAGDRT